MIDRERIVKEFLGMVKITSLSKKEGEFASYLSKRLAGMGLEVIIDEKSRKLTESDTGNVIGRWRGNVNGIPPILFAAHMDTVVPGEDIRPVIRDGVIYSSGDTVLGGDDKSGIAAILEALQHIKEEGIPHGDIEVLFTVGEEIGLLGARYLDYTLLDAKTGYVLDCNGAPGTIINRAPAQDKISAVIYGKAAHAGMNPEEGVSAIQVAARAINNMKLLRIDEETTANIGVINGGAATNIVCDRVELKGEARSLSDEKLALQTQHMYDCLRKACEDMGADLEIDLGREYSSYHIPESDMLIRVAKKAAEAAGLVTRVVSSGGGSDTNYFNVKGIKAVNLGTGMNKVHTTEEEIKVEDLVNTAKLVAAIISERAEN